MKRLNEVAALLLLVLTTIGCARADKLGDNVAQRAPRSPGAGNIGRA
jgi:hypothetical protein